LVALVLVDGTGAGVRILVQLLLVLVVGCWWLGASGCMLWLLVVGCWCWC
jgi:hypothetical protein